MFKTGKNAKLKIQEAKDKIFETYELLKNGDRFAEVAERFSEDESTAVGILPPFGVGKMVSEFETKSFELQNLVIFLNHFKQILDGT